MNTRLSWTVLALTLAGCAEGPADPVGRSEATLDEYLDRPSQTVELSLADYDEELAIARFEQRLEGGLLSVEIAWDELPALGDVPTVVELQPAALDGFHGMIGLDDALVEVPRESAVSHLLDPTNRTLCGSRKLVAFGPVRLDDGETVDAVVGLGWTPAPNASEEGVHEQALAAEPVACPLNHNSKVCQSHAACTITISCGIITFEVAGQCWPQFPFGWPCMCDPLYDLYCASDATVSGSGE